MENIDQMKEITKEIYEMTYKPFYEKNIYKYECNLCNFKSNNNKKIIKHINKKKHIDNEEKYKYLYIKYNKLANK